MAYQNVRKWFKWLLAAVLLGLVAIAVLSWLAPGPVYRGAMAWERHRAGLEPGSVEVDARIWPLLQGGRGEPLLLLHGFGADKDNWVRIAPHLAPHFRLIVPDLPGFGDHADVADGDHAIETQAARVGRLLDGLGLAEVHVGGSSMGGYIALALARERPAQVRSLWLLAPAGVVAAPLSEMMEQIAAGGSNPLIPATAAGFEQTLEYMFVERPFIPYPVRRHLGRRQAARQAQYREMFADLRYRSPPAETLAAGLTQPALIVWGDQDRVLHPDGAGILAAVMASARVERMADVGHLPMIEAPERTARAYLAWYKAAVAAAR